MRQASKGRHLPGRKQQAGFLQCQHLQAMMSRHLGYFLLISLEYYFRTIFVMGKSRHYLFNAPPGSVYIPPKKEA